MHICSVLCTQTAKQLQYCNVHIALKPDTSLAGTHCTNAHNNKMAYSFYGKLQL